MASRMLSALQCIGRGGLNLSLSLEALTAIRPIFVTVLSIDVLLFVAKNAENYSGFYISHISHGRSFRRAVLYLRRLGTHLGRTYTAYS